jgi:hypothetical protein
MTGFDETAPTNLDPDDDATSAKDVGDNVVAPEHLVASAQQQDQNSDQDDDGAAANPSE